MTTQQDRIEDLLKELKRSLSHREIDNAMGIANELDDQLELFFDGIKPVLNDLSNLRKDFSHIVLKVEADNFMNYR